MSHTLTQPRFLTIVEPVLRDMPAGVLHDALHEAYFECAPELSSIEESFDLLTAKKHDQEVLRRFFHSWQQTNNSASSVAGQTCRFTLKANKSALSIEDVQACYNVVNDLQRIVDEDFGAHGELMHADLYYRMATAICGDDSWLSKTYQSEAAKTFRGWMLKQRLRDRSLLNGLLFTLIHETYTHGEMELIRPMFADWLVERLGFGKSEANKTMAWIIVHTGGLEAEHSRHALNAVRGYCKLAGEEVEQPIAQPLFTTYLRYKAAVMSDLIPSLQ
ncbi:MAG: hypothetical protein JO100_02490 [Pseudonocardia sp.]|nr:hypothetical protein [Pseudonocardia sp.]